MDNFCKNIFGYLGYLSYFGPNLINIFVFNCNFLYFDYFKISRKQFSHSATSKANDEVKK